MKKKRWKKMKYFVSIDFWVVIRGDNKGYKVRWGDYFDLNLGNGRKLSCRMELGKQWYVVVGSNDTKLYLKPNETYQIEMYP